MLSFIGRSILRILGWRLVGQRSPELRAVIVGAPHTSNWDFVFFILAAWELKLPIRWMGKKEMFPRPVAWLFKRMGGIPINRSAPGSVVDQSVEAFAAGTPMALLLTPEATRSEAPYWKDGFYRIALGADVPLYLGRLDASKKELGLIDHIELTGDVTHDMDKVRKIYEGSSGFKPDQAGPVRLKSEI